MKYLKEEYDEMMKEKDLKTRRKGLDAFFEKLESDPLYLCPNGVTKEDIAQYGLSLEKAKCMRKVTVLEAQLSDIYKEFGSVSFEMMGDPMYGDMGEEVLEHLSAALLKINEMIEFYKDELLVLGFDILQCEKEYL